MSDVLTIPELVKADSVRHDVDAGRKRLFQIIVSPVDPAAIDKEEAVDEIYDALVTRRLGSTALGMGLPFLITSKL